MDMDGWQDPIGYDMEGGKDVCLHSRLFLLPWSSSVTRQVWGIASTMGLHARCDESISLQNMQHGAKLCGHARGSPG